MAQLVRGEAVGDVVVLGQGRVELVAVPRHLHLVAVRYWGAVVFPEAPKRFRREV
ncbi:hypothetical protein Intca_2647 [Intrasporangium calvum DSM 43043]|uniref:Uncharacterized protein n=1 Tax=Intrasporangium calvum (strain ATCC 23552 / DSM 43043 / JCM 3097 / NBRC 12989 / NCIMB 10167 / NRRL B-3866 / 7 KIP) TaxID=710696 RepID=E6S8J0_INTC7|nr:hypothetical protein Intca_2647 [Intrasporangium calvum DSM 43043]